MNGIELFRLGRRLTKVGVRSLPESDFKAMPHSVRMVMIDVFEHPNSTIGQIVERSGFPQSHVSASVARLREGGILTTTVDPDDGRRTLVTPVESDAKREERIRHIDAPIVDELRSELVAQWGPSGEAHVAEVLAAVETLNRLLVPTSTAQAESYVPSGNATC